MGAAVDEDQVVRAAVVALGLDVHRGHLGPSVLVEPDAVDLGADRACAVRISIVIILNGFVAVVVMEVLEYIILIIKAKIKKILFIIYNFKLKLMFYLLLFIY